VVNSDEYPYQLLMSAEHNLPPVANAGADKIVWLPAETVTLDGSNSTDDQHIASYQWTCESYRSRVVFLISEFCSFYHHCYVCCLLLQSFSLSHGV